MAIVYLIRIKGTSKVYVGQTQYDTLEYRINDRLIGHFTRAFNLNFQSELYEDMRKVGREGVSFEILEQIENNQFNSKEALHKWLNDTEKKYIEKYDSINTG